MKKIFLIMLAPFAFLSASLAQVTQTSSDSIVLERMSQETRQYALYAQIEVQTEGVSIITSMNEVLELTYSCRVYYVNYLEEMDTNRNHYLIVKESSGNLLEVRTQNNAIPKDLAVWRIIPEEPEPPLDSLVLIAQGNLSGSEGIPKQNVVITTQTEWENLLTAMNSVNNVSDSFAETDIDFSKYQIVAVFDKIKHTNGWTIDIDITETADSTVATIQNVTKGEVVIIMQSYYDAIIQPYCIVKIPLSNKPIIFHDETTPEEILDTLVFIAQGNLSGSEGIPKQNVIITTQTEWENLITTMNSVNNVSDSFVETNIDFSKYQVIAIFDTIRPDGAWSIDIVDIMEYADSIVITYTNLDTGDLSYNTTQPYYIIKIPASNKPIVFIDNTIPTKNISITELLPDEFYYWWFDKADSVHIINSQAGLRYYSSILSPLPTPTIDFTKNSVLIIGGYTGYSKYPIADITESLWQISADTYKLCIGIALDYEFTNNYFKDDSINFSWCKAILVPKCIPNSATVLLDVNISQLDTNNLPAGTVLTRNILPDTGCYYGWIKYPIKDSIYIINSQIELNAFNICYPQNIDFNQYSVLMVRGLTPTIVYYVTKNLHQLSGNKYELTVKVFETGYTMPGGWLTVLLVKKLNIGSEIKLNIINTWTW